MGKVYTSARQLTSNGKTAQMLSLLKQRMKVQASPKINPAKAISNEVKVTTKPARVRPRLSTGGTGKYKVTSPKVNPAKVISKEKMNVTTKPVKVKPRLNTSGAGKYKVTSPEINQTGSISKGKINIAAKPSSSSIKLTAPKVSKPQEMPLETKGTGKVETHDPIHNPESWINSLSEAEINALIKYKGNDIYKELNRGLRYDSLNENLKKYVPLLDSAIVKGILSEDMILYRGFSSREIGDNWNRIMEIQSFKYSDDAFVSTSTNPGVAEMFAMAHDDGIFAIIKVKRVLL